MYLKNGLVKLRCPHQEPGYYIQEKKKKLSLFVTDHFPVDLYVVVMPFSN